MAPQDEDELGFVSDEELGFTPEEPLREDWGDGRGGRAATPQADMQPPPPRPAAPIGDGRSAALGFAQGGTYGYADEIGGLFARFLAEGQPARLGAAFQPSESDTPEEAAAKQAALADQAAEPTAYQLGRDAMRGEAARAQKESPWAFGGGNLGGAVAASVLTRKAAPGLAKQSAATQGAIEGAVAGLGGSDADLTEGEFLKAAIDTGAGATLGGFMGEAGQHLGEGLGAAGSWAGRKLGNALSEGAPTLEEAFRRFAQERALKAAGYIQKDFPRAGMKLRRLREGGQTLLDEPGLITPGASSATIADRLEPLVQQEGKAIGRYLDEADAAAGSSFAYDPTRLASRAEAEIATPALENPSVYSQGQRVATWIDRLRAAERAKAARGDPFTFREANEIKGDLQELTRNNRGDVPISQRRADQLQRMMTRDLDQQVRPLIGDDALAEFRNARSRFGTFKDALDKSTQGANRETGNNVFRIDDRQAAEAGAMVGGAPGAAVAGAASKLLRGRGDSVAAVGADRLAKSGVLGRLPGPDALGAAGGSAGAAAGRAVQTAMSTTDWLNMATEQNPEAMGEYGPTLQQAKADGRLAMVHYVLEQKDPNYRAMLEEARKQ